MSEVITETIGLDMGDRYTQYCILDHKSGKEVGTGRVARTPPATALVHESYGLLPGLSMARHPLRSRAMPSK